MAPTFLMLDEVIAIHKDQIENYGGMLGIRDIGLLQSGKAMPKASVGQQFLHEDLASMASAYLFHIVQNHPFIDGNKRTGLASALVFLEINNIEINISEDDIEKAVRKVASGELSKSEITILLRKHLIGKGHL